MELLFSHDAIEDMDNIIIYIAQDNVERAISFWEELEQQAHKLLEFPQLGVELENNYRVLHYKNYSIGYEVQTDKIIIHKVYNHRFEERRTMPIK